MSEVTWKVFKVYKVSNTRYVKKLILITALLLLSPLSWSNALDGKGLICRDNVKASIFNQQVWGVTFVRGYVQMSDIEIKNDKVVQVVGENRKYSTNLTEVIWNTQISNSKSIRFVLDRRTLELNMLDDHLTSIHNKQCEAFEDIDIQREKMQEIVDEKQKVADKILEENQI